VLSVRFEVGVSLLLAPARADKRGQRPLSSREVWGHVSAPPKIFEIGKLGNMISGDLRQNINTQALLIFIRKKYSTAEFNAILLFNAILFSGVYILLRSYILKSRPFKSQSFVIYKTWLDVNFLHQIKALPDCVRELFEVELEADRNDSMDCCRFVVELSMHENEACFLKHKVHHVICAGV